jgi:hypothetical protein
MSTICVQEEIDVTRCSVNATWRTMGWEGGRREEGGERECVAPSYILWLFTLSLSHLEELNR